MDDETLTPFVDLLSGTLVIMLLVAMSFIIQGAVIVTDSARKYTQIKIEEDESSPIEFNRILKIDLDKNEIVYLVNFELTPEEVESIKKDLSGLKSVEFIVSSKDTEKKSVANLFLFLTALKLSKELEVRTKIVSIDESLSKITWGK